VKIAVCIKRVPVMDVNFAIAPDRQGRRRRRGSSTTCRTSTATAVEAALQLTEKLGAGEVHVAISLGPDAVQEHAAQGAEHGRQPAATLLQVRRPFPPTPLAIAQALAAELKDGGYDLVHVRSSIVDRLHERRSRSSMVAELLGLPDGDQRLQQAGDRQRSAGRRAGAHSRAAAKLVSFPLPGGRSPSTRGSQAPALPVAQGDHGRQEEAARRQAGAARRRAVRRWTGWTSPRSALGRADHRRNADGGARNSCKSPPD
jgi:hypothetical protein